VAELADFLKQLLPPAVFQQYLSQLALVQPEPHTIPILVKVAQHRLADTCRQAVAMVRTKTMVTPAVMAVTDTVAS